MINEQKDNLFQLIKSLTKSEKRKFKLYVGRMGSNNNAKFLSLFNFLDKLDRYSEKAILVKGIVTKQQLSNLKAHLYKQILISLRLNPIHQNIRIQIREQMDFAASACEAGKGGRGQGQGQGQGQGRGTEHAICCIERSERY